MPDGIEVRLEDVLVSFPTSSGVDIRVLDQVSLCADPGSVFCIHGRSGSGKTTLLRVAAGFIEPAHGSVRWGGDSVLELPESSRELLRSKLVGYVQQDGGLIPFLTARENVLLGVLRNRVSGDDRERATEVLDELGLADRHSHLPAALSGGERQRVALGRALLRRPPILLIDEPTASLDRRTADEIIELIDTITRRDQVTTVVASHDLQLLSRSGQHLELE